ncbi:hypothetical protein D7Y19_02310 [Stenotrophomonas maltophilia]|nr:hypothetical protein [Stenotrophomonas maltophilia]MBA0318925.1 hypothetical protein [Stenotrophomonas maltophilia]
MSNTGSGIAPEPVPHQSVSTLCVPLPGQTRLARIQRVRDFIKIRLQGLEMAIAEPRLLLAIPRPLRRMINMRYRD